MWRLEWAFWLAKDFSVRKEEGTGTSVLLLSLHWLMAHSPLKDHWNLERWGSLPITHLNNVRSMAEWHGAAPEDPSGPLLKLKASMSDVAAYRSVCRWRVNKSVSQRAVFVSSKHAKEEFDCTFWANERVFKFPELKVHAEQFQEAYLWDEELWAQIRSWQKFACPRWIRLPS